MPHKMFPRTSYPREYVYPRLKTTAVENTSGSFTNRTIFGDVPRCMQFRIIRLVLRAVGSHASNWRGNNSLTRRINIKSSIKNYLYGHYDQMGPPFVREATTRKCSLLYSWH
jgi:hypothetical protein